MTDTLLGATTAGRAAAAPARTGRRPGVRARVATAIVAGLVVTASLVGILRLVGDTPVGAGDNSDGFRVSCAAALLPAATGGRTQWRGVVVTEFDTGGTPCAADVPPTSAGEILQAAVALAPLGDTGTRFSLRWLGALYALLLGVGTGLAAFAATARSRGGLAVLLAPVLPLLVVPWWSRFLVSTYSEAAGLLGAVWVALGLVAVAVTRPDDRGARSCALVLLGLGGLVAATAKPGFLPVGLVAVVACLLVGVGGPGTSATAVVRRRLPGAVLAAVVVALAASPVLSGLRFQNEYYQLNNTHDLVFTGVLMEAGRDATAPLGLAPEAADHAGEGYYWDLGAGVPGYPETVADRPEALRAAARAYLVSHPAVLARMVDRGLEATALPRIPYLPAVGGGPETVTVEPVDFRPQTWLLMGALSDDLAALPVPWLPTGLVAVALAGGVATVLLPRARHPRTAGGTVAVGLVRAGAALAVVALGIVTLAVVGDGYYELAKHVWLASYVLVVAAGMLVTAGAAAALTHHRGWGRPSQ